MALPHITTFISSSRLPGGGQSLGILGKTVAHVVLVPRDRAIFRGLKMFVFTVYRLVLVRYYSLLLLDILVRILTISSYFLNYLCHRSHRFLFAAIPLYPAYPKRSMEIIQQDLPGDQCQIATCFGS